MSILFFGICYVCYINNKCKEENTIFQMSYKSGRLYIYTNRWYLINRSLLMVPCLVKDDIHNRLF